MRLTDQALVAVTVARRHHATAGGPSLAGLLAGLAAEPEGAAGALLGRRPTAAAVLQERAAAAPPRLPPADVALRWAGGEVAPRPAATIDLLLAALETGADDLAEFLAACGYDQAELAAAPRPSAAPSVVAGRPDALAETFGYDPADPGLEVPAAARAVARTRAVAGGAMTLLLALDLEADTSPQAVPLAVDLRDRIVAMRTAGAPVDAADPGWDRGLEAVLDAARRSRLGPGRVSPSDLLRAAAAAGGRGPALLLAADDDAGRR